jgi:hypothetical protein
MIKQGGANGKAIFSSPRINTGLEALRNKKTRSPRVSKTCIKLYQKNRECQSLEVIFLKNLPTVQAKCGGSGHPAGLVGVEMTLMADEVCGARI